VMIDADCTYDPKDMPQLVNPLLKNDADLVIGNRLKGMRKGSMPFLNRVGNRFLSWFAKITLRLGIHDTQCGFKCFKAEVAEELFQTQVLDGWAFDVEVLFIALKRGYKLVEVPIPWYYISGSRVRMFRDALAMLSDLFRIRRNWRRGVYGSPR